MKKTILLITAALILFNFSYAFAASAQNEAMFFRLELFREGLKQNYTKLDEIGIDFTTILDSIGKKDRRMAVQEQAIFNILRNIHTAKLIYKYLVPITSVSSSIYQDTLPAYYDLLDATLTQAKNDLDSSYKSFMIYRPYFHDMDDDYRSERISALQAADKAQYILRDSLDEIDRVLKALSEVIGSSK